MNSFLRHVGKIGDRKIALAFREVPGEPHMCLVVYTEVLNAHIHDAMMQCIESDIGQQSESLADALNRSFTRDGRPLLALLHKEGLMKKVQTSQVLMIPNTQTSIKLDELNKILDDIKNGEAAVKKMAEIESTETVKAMRGLGPVIAASNDALGDNDIAKNLLVQSQKMNSEANGLLLESGRLKLETIALCPSLSSEAAAKPSSLLKSKAKKVKAPTLVPVLAKKKTKVVAEGVR